MKISIITCTWNSAATLADTIDSVQAQSYTNIEHVFVDGGSTDGTLAMIEQRCPDAVVLRNVTGGISRAMNEGAAAASGDAFAHLHSDDYYVGAGVVQQAAAELTAHPRALWVIGRIGVLRDGVVTMPTEPLRRFTHARYVRGACSVPHPAVFIRRAAFIQSGGFDTRLKYAMDIDLWLRLGREHLPVQVDSVFTIFREHAGSASTANVLAARAEEWRVRRAQMAQAPLGTLIYGLRYLRRRARLLRALATTHE